MAEPTPPPRPLVSTPPPPAGNALVAGRLRGCAEPGSRHQRRGWGTLSFASFTPGGENPASALGPPPYSPHPLAPATIPALKAPGVERSTGIYFAPAVQSLSRSCPAPRSTPELCPPAWGQARLGSRRNNRVARAGARWRFSPGVCPARPAAVPGPGPGAGRRAPFGGPGGLASCRLGN